MVTVLIIQVIVHSFVPSHSMLVLHHTHSTCTLKIRMLNIHAPSLVLVLYSSARPISFNETARSPQAPRSILIPRRVLGIPLASPS